MKFKSKIFVAVLLSSVLFFSNFVFAAQYGILEEKDLSDHLMYPVTTKVIDGVTYVEIDVSQMEKREANFIANYEKDFADLLDQLKNQDIYLKQLLEEETKNLEESKVLNELINERIKVLEQQAESTLLAYRYTEDKKELQPEILKAQESSVNTTGAQLSSEYFFNWCEQNSYTINSGNHGLVNGSRGLGWAVDYSGNYYSNFSSNASIWYTGLLDGSGWVDVRNGASLVFLNSIPNSTLNCETQKTGSIMFRGINLDVEIGFENDDPYLATATSLYHFNVYNRYTSQFTRHTLNESIVVPNPCVPDHPINACPNGWSTDFSKGPIVVTFNNYTFTSSHVYEMYSQLDLALSNGGYQDVNLNYSRIEIDF